jgi:CHAT domain-containing protein
LSGFKVSNRGITLYVSVRIQNFRSSSAKTFKGSRKPILHYAMSKVLNLLRQKIKNINIIFKYRLLFFLAIITAVGFNLVTSNKAISETITQQNSTSEQIGEFINQAEKSWEGEYEDYFQRDFTNYSRTEKEIAQQLSELSQKTGTKPAVMWTVPTPERLYLLVITPDADPIIKSVRTTRDKAIAKTINNFNQEINRSRITNSRSYLPSAKLLYKWLIEPIEPELQAAQIDTIMICSGEGLRSFPFAALYDGKQFLIEKYNLVRLPAFNLTDVNYASETKKEMTVLAMGASEFNDLPSLPGVELEVSLITPNILPGKSLLNEDFTVKNLQLQRKQNAYNLIHLATHGQFNPGSATNSFIQFGNNKIGLDQLGQLGLNHPPIDLLVLSACETAVGNQEAEFGFAGLVLQAGVKSTLASLWLIDDSGTVALMSEFYQNLKSGLTRAKALRESQIAMLRGKIFFEDGQLKSTKRTIDLPQASDIYQRDDLSHPFYWAGFSLIGNPW